MMTGLRLGVASPWNVKSAIAQSASEVASELADRGHAITILRTETGGYFDLPARPWPGVVKHISEFSDAELRNEFDLIIGHVGDHFGFHGGLLPRLERVDVLGIFHDVSIENLLSGWVQDDKAFIAGLSARLGGRILTGSSFLDWIAAHTVGGVAHANHYYDRIRRACPGPVSVIPLAFSVGSLPLPPSPWSSVTLAVIGHVNINKRIDQIILAIGASYLLRPRCQIRVIGEATESERRRLISLAESVKVQPPEFIGWVSDERLSNLLRDVDVISCLRNPVLEGASASVIFGLSSRRPVLITNHGCYAEIPADAAFVCSPNSEALDALIHLERMIRDPGYGQATGQRGSEFVGKRHSATAYVDVLNPLLAQCVGMRAVYNARRELVTTLAEFGLEADDPAIRRVMGALLDISGIPAPTDGDLEAGNVW